MEGLRSSTPFARIVADAIDGEFFTLLDIGCSSGIDDAWRVFGDRLRAFGFDPNIEDLAKLTARETLPNVTFVPAFVGLAPGDPGEARMSTGDFWGRMPWNRLSVARTLQIRSAAQGAAAEALPNAEKTEMNLWNEVPLASPHEPVVIPSYLRERGVDDVDFIKIDVDGADFLILRSLVPMLASSNVLGIGIEVNFHGSADPDIHSLHNVDRLLKKEGFELFSLSTRPYSVAALPAPYQLTIPAQTTWGRLLQGDAIYFRDAAAPENAAWSESVGARKLAKLAACFSMTGLPDCAAEVLLRYRSMLENVLDVHAGLDALVTQCVPDGTPVPSYAEYIAKFEADAAEFYPAKRSGGPAVAASTETSASAQEPSSATAVRELARLHDEIASLRSSRSWRLTAPLRALLRSFGLSA